MGKCVIKRSCRNCGYILSELKYILTIHMGCCPKCGLQSGIFLDWHEEKSVYKEGFLTTVIKWFIIPNRNFWIINSNRKFADLQQMDVGSSHKRN